MHFIKKTKGMKGKSCQFLYFPNTQLINYFSSLMQRNKRKFKIRHFIPSNKSFLKDMVRYTCYARQRQVIVHLNKTKKLQFIEWSIQTRIFAWMFLI